MTRTVTLADLGAWDFNASLDDDLHCYFEGLGLLDWPAIADTWRVTHNQIFGSEIEEGSPEEMLASAAVAHSSSCAYAEVAQALGIDGETLRIAVERMRVKGTAPGFAALAAAVDGVKP